MMYAKKMKKKNLTKHPMHPAKPSPRNETTLPNAFSPHPSKPSTTNARTSMPIIPSKLSINELYNRALPLMLSILI